MQVILFTDVSGQTGYGKYAGSYKVATEIRDAGYTCQVIDHFAWLGLAKLKSLVDKFVSNDTLVIGISCTLNEQYVNGNVQHWGIPDAEFIELIDYAKSKNNSIKIVAGGARINICDDWPYIDYAIVRKADIAIIKLLDHIRSGSELTYTQNFYTKVIKGDDYFYTQEQFASSIIKYEHNDIVFPNEALPIEIARGCIFSCSFCKFDLIGKRIGDWTKTNDALYNEFMRNYTLYGVTDYLFADELVNESVGKMEMLCSVVRRLPFKLKYTAFARLDLIHRYPQMRELLLESGAVNLLFGIETLNTTVGRRIGKGLNSDHLKNTLKYCNELWKNKIIVSATFIIGLPGETEESIWDSFHYVAEEDNGIDMFHFFPLHISNVTGQGIQTSKIEDDPSKYGYTFQNNIWESGTLTLAQAEDLSTRIQNHDKMLSRNKSNLSWISRYSCLGYSMDALFNMVRSSDDHRAEIDVRSNGLREEYYRRLLEL